MMSGMSQHTPSEVPGIDQPSLERWFLANVPGAVAPFSYDLIAGGHSNLTFKVTDAAGNRYVLRRPPLNTVLATAHDMMREYRAIHALRDTPVPVPRAFGICQDPAVNGADFYVMAMVDGYVQHDLEATLAHSTPASRKITADSLVDVLADLHAVDVDAVGMDAHGPREGYIERQIRRWYKQWNAGKNREVPLVDSVYERLLERVPEQGPATIVHGDYRIGNCITSFEGPIAAVLDWEISTLGDPLADLGYLLNSWHRPGDPGADQNYLVSPSLADGYPERDELVARYAARSGRDVSNIGFYVAFNHWKSTCIIQGVLSRYLAGAKGEDHGVDLSNFVRSIDYSSKAAADALDAIG